MVKRRYVDTVYTTQDGRIRISVDKVVVDDEGHFYWNAHIFFCDGTVYNWAEGADGPQRKRDLLADLTEKYGPLRSIQPCGEITEGWRCFRRGGREE